MSEQEMYIIVPDSLIDHPEINLLDIKLYGRIRRLKLGCNASHTTLANWCNCSRRSATRSLAKLKRLGFLVRDNQGYLVIAVSRITSDLDDTGVATQMSTTSDPDVPVTSDPDVPHTNIYISTNKNTINNKRGGYIKSVNDIPNYKDIDLNYHKPLNEWLAYKAENGKAYKSLIAIRKLVKLYPTTLKLQQAVDHSIGNNYQGCFAPTSTQQNKNIHPVTGQTLSTVVESGLATIAYFENLEKLEKQQNDN
jgi:hypothetical protein